MWQLITRTQTVCALNRCPRHRLVKFNQARNKQDDIRCFNPKLATVRISREQAERMQQQTNLTGFSLLFTSANVVASPKKRLFLCLRVLTSGGLTLRMTGGQLWRFFFLLFADRGKRSRFFCLKRNNTKRLDGKKGHAPVST